MKYILKNHLISFQIIFTKTPILCIVYGFLRYFNPKPTFNIKDSVDQDFRLFLQFSDTVPQERTNISGVLLENQQLDTTESCAAPYGDGQLRMG